MNLISPTRSVNFPEGVSGFCLSDTDALIWTRVTAIGARSQAVQWDVYRAGHCEPLRSGLALASAETAYVVRVLVTDLPPGEYQFSFSTQGTESPRGDLRLLAATRTARAA